MSSRAINEAIRRGKYDSDIFDCCTPASREPYLTQGQGHMLPCDPCLSPCPVAITAVTIDLEAETAISNQITVDAEGTYSLDSIEVVEGAVNIVMKLTFATSSGNVVIGTLLYSGDTAGVPPATPITITSGSSYDVSAPLDTSTIGVGYSVTVTIETECGTIEITQPFDIVAP